MSIDLGFTMPVPASLAAVEATFTSMSALAGPAAGSPATPGNSSVPATLAGAGTLGAPSDPFSVLLAAASAGAPRTAAPATAAPAAELAASGAASVARAGAVATAGISPSTTPAGAPAATTRAVAAATPPAAIAPAAAASPGPVTGLAPSPVTAAGGSAASAVTAAGAATELASLGAVAGPLAGTSTGTAASPASAPGGSASGTAIVGDALRYLGVPYRWGGTDPSTGFDCSGLVQHVFADLGVALPRTSYEQVNAGMPVAGLGQAQPGDLLFFEPGQNGAGPGEPGHVAIYAGDGEMIAAPETGQDVQIQPVPGTPIAIRRVEVPAATAAAGSAGPAGPDASTLSADPAASGNGTSGPSLGASTVQIGQVAVPASYASLVETSAEAAGIPASLLAAVIDTESGFDPGAVSSAGAQGIAQFMPGTAAELGVQPFDPTSAIPGAARYLAELDSRFGSWPLALAAYNAGPAAVATAGDIPDNGQTPADVATVLARSGMSSPQGATS